MRNLVSKWRHKLNNQHRLRRLYPITRTIQLPLANHRRRNHQQQALIRIKSKIKTLLIFAEVHKHLVPCLLSLFLSPIDPTPVVDILGKDMLASLIYKFGEPVEVQYVYLNLCELCIALSSRSVALANPKNVLQGPAINGEGSGDGPWEKRKKTPLNHNT